MSLMLSLAACSGSSDNSSTADNSGSSEDLYSIAMVTDVGGVNDQSFNLITLPIWIASRMMRTSS